MAVYAIIRNIAGKFFFLTVCPIFNTNIFCEIPFERRRYENIVKIVFFLSRVYSIIIRKKCEIPISFHVQFNNRRRPEALSAPQKSPFSADQDKCVWYTKKETTTLVQRCTDTVASALDFPGAVVGGGWLKRTYL